MNKFVFLALAIVGACALAEAGRINEDEEVLRGARNAFSNVNFFSDLIAKEQKSAEAQLNLKDTFKKRRDQFQKSIDANPENPIPRPLNKEVEVYLHEGADEDEEQTQHDMSLSGLFEE